MEHFLCRLQYRYGHGQCCVQVKKKEIECACNELMTSTLFFRFIYFEKNEKTDVHTCDPFKRQRDISNKIRKASTSSYSIITIVIFDGSDIGLIFDYTLNVRKECNSILT